MTVPRHHHYVPQFYLRNFAHEEKLNVFGVATNKNFSTNVRNVAGERDLYRLEGAEPLLAEEMFSEIEGAITPIISKALNIRELPDAASDEFVSLLYFAALSFARHPNWLSKIEDFKKTVMERTLELFAHNIPEQGKRLIDGQIVTKRQALEAHSAMQAGRLRLHIPRDQSLSTALSGVDKLTETLLGRNWMLAFSENGDFITSSNPLLLVWDDLEMHLRHPPGFGLNPTTVYFPLSPNILMIGKFAPIVKSLAFDEESVAAVNAMRFLNNPKYLFARKDSSPLLTGKNPVHFKDLGSVPAE